MTHTDASEERELEELEERQELARQERALIGAMIARGITARDARDMRVSDLVRQCLESHALEREELEELLDRTYTHAHALELLAELELED